MNASMVPLACAVFIAGAHAQQTDPRLREVLYDAHTVVTVPVKKGVVTHVVLDADEAITDVAAGLGADCAKPEATWCIAAQAGGRNIFVKAKSTASSPNNVAVVTDRRAHSFRFVVLPDNAAPPPVYRLVVRTPVTRTATALPPDRPPAVAPTVQEPPAPAPASILPERLQTAPKVLNSSYAIAEGDASDDIAPTLIFDDGRFTYLRVPGNREVPAVFHVLADGSETLVNTRMEGDLLVVDRVSRRLMLRAGKAVVGVWNEAFDLDGEPPQLGTTVGGVRRALRPARSPEANNPARGLHE
jgi:type IV secretion system protein VirB9